MVRPPEDAILGGLRAQGAPGRSHGCICRVFRGGVRVCPVGLLWDGGLLPVLLEPILEGFDVSWPCLALTLWGPVVLS